MELSKWKIIFWLTVFTIVGCVAAFVDLGSAFNSKLRIVASVVVTVIGLCTISVGLVFRKYLEGQNKRSGDSKRSGDLLPTEKRSGDSMRAFQ
jgi:hypothetical protein